MTDAKLRTVLAAAPAIALRTVVTRFVFERHRMRATSPAGAAKIGGRYNPAGIEALYTSFTRTAALAEFTQDYGDAEPIAVSCMLSLLISLDRVVDLTEPALLREFGNGRSRANGPTNPARGARRRTPGRRCKCRRHRWDHRLERAGGRRKKPGHLSGERCAQAGVRGRHLRTATRDYPLSITRAAFQPEAPITPPPGCVAAPHM